MNFFQFDVFMALRLAVAWGGPLILSYMVAYPLVNTFNRVEAMPRTERKAKDKILRAICFIGASATLVAGFIGFVHVMTNPMVGAWIMNAS